MTQIDLTTQVKNHLPRTNMPPGNVIMQGAWISNITYEPGDSVYTTPGGICYTATQQNTGINPDLDTTGVWIGRTPPPQQVGNVQFADEVVPGGVIDGTNAVFTLPQAPSPISSLMLFVNNARVSRGVAFNLEGATITYVQGYIPHAGDTHICSYRY